MQRCFADDDNADRTVGGSGAGVPHMQVRLVEEELGGGIEARVIAAMTDAVVSVYGEWVRPQAVVDILGVPRARWGVGGVPGAAVSPQVTLTTRERALQAPDGARRLIEAITSAVGDLFGDRVRESADVVLVGTPEGRSGVGGVPV
jgi:phenylpyruvate tautomerase PptA (4-oxalocrotonate tautomerase family)